MVNKPWRYALGIALVLQYSWILVYPMYISHIVVKDNTIQYSTIQSPPLSLSLSLFLFDYLSPFSPTFIYSLSIHLCFFPNTHFPNTHSLIVFLTFLPHCSLLLVSSPIITHPHSLSLSSFMSSRFPTPHQRGKTSFPVRLRTRACDVRAYCAIHRWL